MPGREHDSRCWDGVCDPFRFRVRVRSRRVTARVAHGRPRTIPQNTLARAAPLWPLSVRFGLQRDDATDHEPKSAAISSSVRTFSVPLRTAFTNTS
jgi:hypothetical protein